MFLFFVIVNTLIAKNNTSIAQNARILIVVTIDQYS